MAIPPLDRLNRLRKFEGSTFEDMTEYLSTEMRQNWKSIEDTFGAVKSSIEDKLYYSVVIPDVIVADANIAILPSLTTIFETDPLPLKSGGVYLVSVQPFPESPTFIPNLGFIGGSRRGQLYIANNFESFSRGLIESSTLDFVAKPFSFIFKSDLVQDTFKIQIGRTNTGAASSFALTQQKLVIREI